MNNDTMIQRCSAILGTTLLLVGCGTEEVDSSNAAWRIEMGTLSMGMEDSGLGTSTSTSASASTSVGDGGSTDGETETDTETGGGDPPTPNPLECCNFDDQLWLLVPDCTDPDPNDDYDITPRPMEDCDEEQVCCDTGLSTYVKSSLSCTAGGGTIVNNAECGTVCCAELTNGIWQTMGFMQAFECLGGAGTREVVSNERCFEVEETICDCDHAVDPGLGGTCLEETCAWFVEGPSTDPHGACHCSWELGGSTG